VEQSRVGERAAEAAERARLTFRRLAGLDRSGPPPPETVKGAPLRPWTIPNAIGYVRIALLPVFLVLAFNADGQSAAATIIFAVVAWSDYFDGIAARLTGQYSRLGTLMDPVIDRLLTLSGGIVCFWFELLPRWALILLVVREVFVVCRPLRPAPRRRHQGQLARPGRGVAGVLRAVLRHGGARNRGGDLPLRGSRARSG